MNIGMFREQQAVWADYPDDVKANLHVIVVDDCSPKGHRLSRKSVKRTGIASLQIYKLLPPKVPWNWLACRNLGAELAQTEWLFLTDMDHVVPSETWRRVMDGPLSPENAYRFSRVHVPQGHSLWPYDVSTLPPWKPHNDTWMLTKAMFWDPRVGGYDERLSGCYGTSGEFKDRVTAAASAKVLLPDVIIRYGREVIPDASTDPLLYGRKNDPINDAKLIAKKGARAQLHEWRPLHGTFPHELVYDSAAVMA